jgi:hypothetical protein
MQTGAFTIIEVCEGYCQCGVVTCYALEAAQDFANIYWQFITVGHAMAGLT